MTDEIMVPNWRALNAMADPPACIACGCRPTDESYKPFYRFDSMFYVRCKGCDRQTTQHPTEATAWLDWKDMNRGEDD